MSIQSNQTPDVNSMEPAPFKARHNSMSGEQPYANIQSSHGRHSSQLMQANLRKSPSMPSFEANSSQAPLHVGPGPVYAVGEQSQKSNKRRQEENNLYK